MMEPKRRMSSKEMNGEARALQRQTRRRTRGGCETATVTTDDVDDATDSERSPSLLWEKHFQQTILVDISDDDSLSLSDVRGSFTVHVSQGSAASHSVPFSESQAQSDSGDAGEDSSVCPESVSSTGRGQGTGVVRGRDVKASGPRADPAAERPQHEDDTSDEEQEDLPYDAEPQCGTCPSPKPRADLRTHSLTSAQHTDVPQTFAKRVPNMPRGAAKTGSATHHADPAAGPETGQAPDSVPEFLLRFVSQEELLNCGRLIEAETLPEVSLLESIDETILSRATDVPHTSRDVLHTSRDVLLTCTDVPHTSTDVPQTSTDIPHTSTDVPHTSTNVQHTSTDVLHDSTNVPHTSTDFPYTSTDIFASKPWLSLAEEEEPSRADTPRSSETFTSKPGFVGTAPVRISDPADVLPADCRGQPACSGGLTVTCAGHTVSSLSSAVVLAEGEERDEEEGAKRHFRDTRRSWERAPSSGELKYGQGQVHYPQPDFSKVASKVRIPRNKRPDKLGCQSPAVDKTYTTPSIVGKSPACTADIISRVLEDTVWSCALRDEQKQSKLDQYLQAEYDRLLAKYPEDDNLIIPTKTRCQNQVCSEPLLSTGRSETADALDSTSLESRSRPSPAGTQTSRTGLVEQKSVGVWERLSEQGSHTEGQRLTIELKDIIHQFLEKVDEFQTNINQMSMTVEEQQMVFKSMVEAQDQLERNYMSKKEEHRALEMQRYMGLNRNTGQFDPDREVEGEIFRLGMQLEVIKEQIDTNARHELSPPASPPALTPHRGEVVVTPPHRGEVVVTPPLREEVIIASVCQPSLHEESVFSISHTPAEEEEHFKVTDEEPMAGDSAVSQPRDTTLSRHLPGPSHCSAGEDEESSMIMAGVEDDHEDVLAQLVESRPQPLQRTPSRAQDIGWHLRDSPIQLYTNKTQRYVSPERDSGFGASDLSRPPTGLSHTQHDQSLAPSDDVTSMTSVITSDNDTSLSNLQTTVSMATWAGWPKMGESDLPNSVQNIQWNYTIHNAPVRSHLKAEAPLHGEEGATLPAAHLQEAAAPGQLVNEAPDRHTHSPSTVPDRHAHSPSTCPSSDLIHALQYEVSCLKRVLEDRLGYLPQPSHTYPQRKRIGGQHRPRQQHRPASSRYPNIDLIHKKVEDWMSSDIELTCNHSGPDSGEPDSPPAACVRPSHRASHDQCRTPSLRAPAELKYSSMGSLETVSTDMVQSNHGNRQRANSESTNHSSGTSVKATSHSINGGFGLTNHRKRVSRSNEHRATGENRCSITRHFPHPLHKPLLQMNYGSCYSFSSVFKVHGQRSEPGMSTRRCSIQPDSALLPKQVSALHTSPCWTGVKAWPHRDSKETMVRRTLDEALEAVMLLKTTTERMAECLSADISIETSCEISVYGGSHLDWKTNTSACIHIQ